MSRLPTPGSDDGNWGEILNDYLEQAHKSDGTLKDDILTDAAISPDNIDGDAATPSLRTLGDGAQQAYPGSAGAANAATIAALEESADSGLTTEIASLYGGTAAAISTGGISTFNISIQSYVTVTPSWFSMGTYSFQLTEPGLYLVSGELNASLDGTALFITNCSGGLFHKGSINNNTMNSLYGRQSITTFIAVFDADHAPTDPEFQNNISVDFACAGTDTTISFQFRAYFTGGGSKFASMNQISITRIQSNPISL